MSINVNKNLHEKVPPNLWLVHGKLYDFEPFLDKHPGGKVNLLVGNHFFLLIR
jgi:cytochrome b involved in lipid metabolism